MKKYVILAFIFIGIKSNAQKHQFQLNFSYGIDIPLGDLQDRYGLDYNPALDIVYTVNQKTFFGVHGHYILGNRVKEDVIAPLRHEETGGLIDQTRDISFITLKQRAYLFGIHGGRFFNISKTDLKHGPRLRFGISMLTHYIIFNDERASTFQLRGIYSSGYDRLTRGFSLEQFIGYQVIMKNTNTVLFGGVNVVESRGKSLRPIDFDTGVYGGDQRNDILFGFRVGASIQLYEFGEQDEVIYY